MTVSIDDFEMGRRKVTAPLTVAEGERVNLQAPAGQYYVHYTIFSRTSQQLNAPCGSKTGAEVTSATWGQACGWCNLRLSELAKLGNPVLTIKFVSSDKSQTIRGVSLERIRSIVHCKCANTKPHTATQTPWSRMKRPTTKERFDGDVCVPLSRFNPLRPLSTGDPWCTIEGCLVSLHHRLVFQHRSSGISSSSPGRRTLDLFGKRLKADLMADTHRNSTTSTLIRRPGDRTCSLLAPACSVRTRKPI